MRIVIVVGARPQFIKAAAVSRAIRAHNGEDVRSGGSIREVLVHTGQHYDYLMSEVFFRELGLSQPDYNLEVGSGSHGTQTGLMLSRLDEILSKEEPDWVVVYGDTNSTLAGALAAAKLHVPVAHVEAGLRSFNRRMPEEINRVLTDHISHLLFCPTETSVRNLTAEGISEGVHLVGDVMCDTLLHYFPLAERRSTILRDLGLDSRFALCTVHRAENTDDPARLEGILTALNRLAADGFDMILPIHPRTRSRLKDQPHFAPHPRLRIIDPVGYGDLLVLAKHAHVVLTDSGGLQKEAYLMSVPCVTLRDETEWLETVETGWNTLVGTSPDRIVAAARLSVAPAGGRGLYGDGFAASKIVRILAGSREDSGLIHAAAPSGGI